MSAETELLPCPFCGKKDTPVITSASELANEDDYPHQESYTVICDASTDGPGGCGADGGFMPSVKGAIAKWNTRASPTPPEAQGESVRDALEKAIKTLEISLFAHDDYTSLRHATELTVEGLRALIPSSEQREG